MSMFQTKDQGLLQNLRENLDNPERQLMSEPESLELKQQVFKTYPFIFKRFENTRICKKKLCKSYRVLPQILSKPNPNST